MVDNVFEELSEVRSVARARAVEDFSFFALHVLGLKIEPYTCESIQTCVEKDFVLYDLKPVEHKALELWLCVLGRSAKVSIAPTDTFAWLFGDRVERAA